MPRSTSSLAAPAPCAAVVNAASAHCQDWDDHEVIAQTHPSIVLVPAILALAEERQKTGRDLLEAYLVGFEAIVRIGQGCALSLYERGWHATSAIGAVGAAAACARLIGLDQERFAHALGIAVSMASGFTGQFGTATKHLHPGLAAQAGIMAACYAESGFDASHEGVDGRLSLATRLADVGEGFEAFAASLGKPLAMLEFGVVVKRYPSCGCTHRIMDGLETLQMEHGFGPEDVASIVGKLPGVYGEILRYPDPQNANEARFSLQYCLASLMIDGDVTPAQFRPEAIIRSDVRALMARVSQAVLTDADTPSYAPSGLADEIVEVTLGDGRALRAVVRDAVGSPARPLSPEDFAAKVAACCEGRLDIVAQKDLIEACARLENLSDIRDLTRLVS